MNGMTKMDYIWYHGPGALRAGDVHPEHFRQLIAISGIHSSRVILALEDHLVHGISRREICERHTISASYLSSSLTKLQTLSQAVVEMYPWYARINGPEQVRSGNRSDIPTRRMVLLYENIAIF
ncbi:PapB/FocB family fimbrial expression transcriptional regulator [Citrobacter braakii]|uniref:PapB/FocB family fimbrial expression transcriptional regulator n=1 Tax=Citrobacter braakii TaxID=57706 RepID=UPI00351D44D3